MERVPLADSGGTVLQSGSMKSLDTGESPVITVRMPRSLVEELDRWCDSLGESRAEFIRNAVAVMTVEYEQNEVQR